jgi:threonyl-tRNA synthetase
VQEVTQELRDIGIRAVSDLRNEKIGFKIREHTMQRIPYLLVVGDREVETRTIAVRTRTGKDLGTFPLAEVKHYLTSEINARRSSNLEE